MFVQISSPATPLRFWRRPAFTFWVVSERIISNDSFFGALSCRTWEPVRADIDIEDPSEVMSEMVCRPTTSAIGSL